MYRFSSLKLILAGIALVLFSIRPAAAQAQVVINEVEAGYFIELYDGGTGSFDLSGMTLVLFNGSNDLSYGAYDLDGYTTNPSGYFLIAESGVPGADLVVPVIEWGADAAALYLGDAADFPDGSAITEAGLLDAIVYDTGDSDDPGLRPLLNRNQHQVNEDGAGPTSYSLQRIPNGSGGGRNTWTYVPRVPTPGSENVHATIDVCASSCAHTTIQAAVTAADYGDVVLVYPDTYFENVDFGGKAVTLQSVGGAGVTTIDGGDVTRVLKLDSANREYYHSIIDGFTITNGTAWDNGSSDRDGGGILSEGNWLTVSNSIVSDNTTVSEFGEGGGIWAEYTHLILNDTVVDGNACGYSGGGIHSYRGSLSMTGGSASGNTVSGGMASWGGGIYVARGDMLLSGVAVNGNSGPQGGGAYYDGNGYLLEVSDCSFDGNTAGEGGGLYVDSGEVQATIADSTFNGNTAEDGGGMSLYNGYAANLTDVQVSRCDISGNVLTGATSVGDGGGMYVSKFAVTISDSTVNGNGPAFNGGGIECRSSASLTLENSTVSGNFIGPVFDGWKGAGLDLSCSSVIRNSVISGNRNQGSLAIYGGGGIWVGGSLEMYNSTVSGNEAVRGGGLACYGSSEPVLIVNSLFRGNSEGGLPNEIEGCDVTAAYSDIEGGDPGSPGQPWPGTGNVDVDPLFVDGRPSSEAPTAAGNYHVRPGSPAIDAGTGDTVTWPGLPSDDFEGHGRPIAAGYDMGADEHAFRSDWNADGKPDLFWRNYSSGGDYLWYMNGAAAVSGTGFPTVGDTSWGIASTADFNNDGKPDLLWRNSSTGANYLWYMDGPSILSGALVAAVGTEWELAAVSDFNADHHPDLLWRNPASGQNYLWHMTGAAPSGGSLLPPAGPEWSVAAADDFNSDGRQDILWRQTSTGAGYVWYRDGSTVIGGASVPLAAPDWSVDGTADFNGDGKPDLCWRNYTTGENYLWYLDGVTVTGGALLPPMADPNWHIEQ